MQERKVEPRHYRLIHTIFFFLIILMVYVSGSYKKIHEDLTSIPFITMFFLVSAFIYWGLHHPEDGIKRSTQRATSAFIIAYLAHIDMVFTAFMVVWMFVFHTGEAWV